MKTVKLADHNVDLIGRFRLRVKADPQKFRITNINAYVPKGKGPNDMELFRTNQGEVESLLIDRLSVHFNPDINDNDKHNIKLLIGHPKVMIEGFTDKQWDKLVKLGLKVSNPKFVLTNLDKVEISTYEKDAKLAEARYILYNKEAALTKDKLVWLCSFFDIPYKSETTNEQRYKIEITKKLDVFLQSDKKHKGLSALEAFVKAIKEIKHTEMIYYINELINLEIIINFGGIYKIEDRPVGSTKEDIIDFYEKSPEYFLEHKKLVLEKVRNEVYA